MHSEMYKSVQNSQKSVQNQNKNRWNSNGFMAEGTGLEPAGLLHLTRFPGELLSHSVNSPSHYSVIFIILFRISDLFIITQFKTKSKYFFKLFLVF